MYNLWSWSIYCRLYRTSPPYLYCARMVSKVGIGCIIHLTFKLSILLGVLQTSMFLISVVALVGVGHVIILNCLFLN